MDRNGFEPLIQFFFGRSNAGRVLIRKSVGLNLVFRTLMLWTRYLIVYF